MDWDDSKRTLHITDPYLRFYLRWQVRENRRHCDAGLMPRGNTQAVSRALGKFHAQSRHISAFVTKGRAMMAELVSLVPSSAEWKKYLSYFDEQIASLQTRMR